MPKFRVTFPIEVRVRLRHSVVVEADDEEIAKHIAALKTRRIQGEPNLFSYICPNRDTDMRDFQLLADSTDPFSKITWANCSCEEVEDNA